jgi:hypothetical protein
VLDDFAGGLDTSARPELVPRNCLLTANNISLRQRKILADTGYTTFGTAVRGTPQADFQIFYRNGTSELVLITTATVYTFNSGKLQWQYVAGTAKTTTTGSLAAGGHNLAVTAITGFSNGDNIGVILDDGSQLQTTINGAPSGTTIVMTAAVPVGRSVPTSAVVVRAVVLSGILDNQVSVVPVPSNNWVAFTNGEDLPQRYDGSTCVQIPNLPVGFTACTCIAQYNSSLFLIGTIEGGTAFPQRSRRSDIGDPTNWTTNLAGFDDLFDGTDFCLAAEVMGSYLFIYRERSIVQCQFVNTNGQVYAYNTMVEGEGAVSTQAVVNLNNEHLLFGNVGIYSYNGGYAVQSIGDNIFYKVFSPDGDFNPNYKQRVFAFYVEELDEAWFFYPSGTSTTPNILLKYSVGDQNWSRSTMVDTFIGYGFYQTIAANAWNNLSSTWAGQQGNWNSKTVSGGSPTTHLMGTSSNMVMQFDYIATSDNGVAIASQLETIDFFNKEWSMRFDTLYIYCKGTSVLVEYSIDSGQTYQTLGTLTNTTLQIQQLTQQFICDKIRFRISCSSPGFELDWISFDYFEEASSAFRKVR